MPTQQQKTELLTFGYVNETSTSSVPIDLIQLIQLYYDKYRYFCLKNEMLNRFLTAKNGEGFHVFKFSIKGIQFGIRAYPNGPNAETKNVVIMGVQRLNIPKDIEYIDYYQEIKCEQLNHDHCTDKRLQRITKRHSGKGGAICKLSQLNNMKLSHIDFNYCIDIKYIKYKKESKKKNYIGSINKLHKMNTFKWDINESMMERYKKMEWKPFEKILSDSFDSDNWCLGLSPNGINIRYKGFTGIAILCLSFPFNVKKINAEITWFIDGELFKTTKMSNAVSSECSAIMTLDEFRKKESISFEVILKISNVYDENDDEIEEKEWNKYGIIV